MSLDEITTPLDVTLPPIMDPIQVRAYRVLPEFVEPVWAEAEPLLKRAIQTERGRYSTRDIFRWVKANEQQLWVVMRGREMIAAGMMRCYIHPSGKHGASWHLLGARPGARVWEWIDSLMRAAMAEARARGCSEMIIIGRRGWLRFAQRYGFKPEATVLLREEIET